MACERRMALRELVLVHTIRYKHLTSGLIRFCSGRGRCVKNELARVLERLLLLPLRAAR